ncbi:alpha/beta hydrolase [Halobacteriales archaeon QS_8_65_32]|jgi:pimeloyl-ACP methyl ester carboxylesterase|nr:MAG: alpha/beta hydrolase [Halobacteriales archaeon QS_8_65_32]
METVTHYGRKTAYRVVDTEGPRRLYVHGSGADHRLWARQYASGGVALDVSGHGESEDVDAEPGYETLSAYADDVLAVAAQTDCRVLVGNSLGGAVCLHLLLERGSAADAAFDALVLAGSGAKLGVLSSLREKLDDDFERAIDFLHEPNRLLHDPEGLGSDAHNGNDPIARSKEAMRETGQAVAQRDFLSCHRFDVRDRLDEIAMPTLALCGEYDRLTPPEYHDFLAREIPDAEREVVPDAAHLAMVERPGEFDAAVDRFLDRRLGD